MPRLMDPIGPRRAKLGLPRFRKLSFAEIQGTIIDVLAGDTVFSVEK